MLEVFVRSVSISIHFLLKKSSIKYLLNLVLGKQILNLELVKKGTEVSTGSEGY